jgi:hypothetical protein
MNQVKIMLDSKAMQTVKARIENGQVVVASDAFLPEGAEVELRVITNDGMSDEERQRLHVSIIAGIEDGRAGRCTDADEFISELQALDAADID